MTRYGYGVTDVVLRQLVHEVLEARDPGKLNLVPRLPLGPEDPDTTEAIRGVLADELVESGLGIDGEPNERGRLIEAAVDWLGHS